MLRVICLGTLVAVLFLSTVPSQVEAADAPPELAAALIVKLVGFEKTVAAGGDIAIYVIGAQEWAAKLKGAVGQKIGKATLASVDHGDGLPTDKPSILCLGDAAKVADVTAYTQAEKVLSVTNQPDLATDGITLALGVGDDGKPQVTLNLASSKAEGRDWNPAIMKIAKTVK